MRGRDTLAVLLPCLQMLSAVFPWEDHVTELVNLEENDMVNYEKFLARYKIDAGSTGWNARLLGEMYAALSKANLSETLLFFDKNDDGVVTVEELTQVCTLMCTSLGEHALAAGFTVLAPTRAPC